MGCDNNNEQKDGSFQNAEIEKLTSENIALKNQFTNMEKQIEEYKNKNHALEQSNNNLEEVNNNLIVKDHEIKFDLKIPIDILKVVYDHFLAIEDKDINKIKETLLPDVDSENRVFQLWDYGEDNTIRLYEISYQFENEYQSGTRTTKSIVVGVKYNNDKNVSFALQNTNNEGWRIYDID